MTSFNRDGVGSLRALAGVTYERSQITNYDEPTVVENAMAEKISDFAMPENGLNSGSAGSFDFVIPASAENYLLLNKSYLDIRMKVVKKDGSDCGADDNYSLVNNFGQSMWRKCNIYINGVEILPNCADMVNYKSYLESIASFDSDAARECNLVTNIFYMDQSGKYTNFTKEGTLNTQGKLAPYNMGYVVRARHCKNSQTFDAAPKIPHPFFRCDKALAPNNSLRVKLTLATDDFMILSSTNDYKLKILDIKLHFIKIRENPTPAEAPLEKYDFTLTEMRAYPIPAGMPQYVVPISSQGIVPKQVIYFLTSTNATEGAANTNPFYFRHFNCVEHFMKVNDKIYPAAPLTPNFDNTPPLVMRCLHEVKANTGYEGTDKSNCITYQQYCDGATIFPHDLTVDQCNSRHLHESTMGGINSHFKWTPAPTEPLTLFAYMVYDALLTHKPSDMYFQLHII